MGSAKIASHQHEEKNDSRSKRNVLNIKVTVAVFVNITNVTPRYNFTIPNRRIKILRSQK